MTQDPLVVFTPSGKRGHFPVGTPILTAARQLGVDLDSVCGGRGICSKCQIAPSFGDFPKHGVTVSEDALSEWNEVEARYDRVRGLKEGRRLGCQATVQGDIVVDVPPESQVHRQVVRKAASDRPIEMDPATRLLMIEVQEPDMHEPSGDFERLAEALNAGEIEPYFQPQVRVSDGAVVGFEALARWTSAEYGQVEPTEFVRIAEQVGLTGQLIELMLDRSLRQLGEWHNHSPDLRVAVNVSAIDLANRDLVSLVSSTLYTHGIDPSRLVIEMTETSFVHDLAEISSSVNGLRALGVAVSLDDFGTGYSALTSLRDLPVDEIKVDRSFVDRFASGTDRDTRIARAMTSMGRSLGLDVVAEGVEDAKTRDQLIEMGCTHLQGFFFASPMSPQEATIWLRTGPTFV